jgi:hypothetical protein
MSRYLIRSKGDLQLVESLDGYPNAPVLGTNIADPTEPDLTEEERAARVAELERIVRELPQ